MGWAGTQDGKAAKGTRPVEAMRRRVVEGGLRILAVAALWLVACGLLFTAYQKTPGTLYLATQEIQPALRLVPRRALDMPSQPRQRQVTASRKWVHEAGW